MYKKGMDSRDYGTVYGFDAVAATVAAEFGVDGVSGKVLGGD